MKPILKFFLKLRGIIYGVVILAIFISLLVIIKAPIKQAFEYDLDEGTELIKASLFLNKFSLYQEIWSDVPPLFTVILSLWLKLFGLSVYHARLLILIFSVILLAAFYGIIKKTQGRFCAFIAVIFLLYSMAYLRLSISIMPGIPALSLAMLSILCVTIYKNYRLKPLLVLSGILMAFSLQTKFFSAFLILPLVLEIIQTGKLSLTNKEKGATFFAVFLWIITVLIAYFYITILYFHFNFQMFIQQLFQPHLNKISVPRCNFSLILNGLMRDYNIAILALIGIILIIKQRKRELLFPVLWLILALLILLIFRPVWYHYYPLVSIPISWLAAISFSEFFRTDLRKGWPIRKNVQVYTDVFLHWLTIIIIALTVLMAPFKYNGIRRQVWGETTIEERKIVEFLSAHKKQANWIFTDRPIFAFYADMLAPPELAVITDKRKFTSTLNQAYCIDKLKKYKPELVLLNIFKYCGPEVISFIEKNYLKIYQGKVSRLIPVQVNHSINYSIWLTKIKEALERMRPINHKDYYKVMYRRLGKKPRYDASYRLIDTLDGLIESYTRLSIEGDAPDPNDISPLTIKQDGRFEIKSYDDLPAKWLNKFPAQANSFFAHQVLKKIFKEWLKEEGKLKTEGNPADVSLKISRLKSLKEKISQEIKNGDIINSFNPSGPPSIPDRTPQTDITLYIRKDLQA